MLKAKYYLFEDFIFCNLILYQDTLETQIFITNIEHNEDTSYLKMSKL